MTAAALEGRPPPQLARSWPSDALEWIGAGLFLALAAFWLLVTGSTLRAIWAGEAWRR